MAIDPRVPQRRNGARRVFTDQEDTDRLQPSAERPDGFRRKSHEKGYDAPHPCQPKLARRTPAPRAHVCLHTDVNVECLDLGRRYEPTESPCHTLSIALIPSYGGPWKTGPTVNTKIYLFTYFLPTIFGSIYCGPP